MAEGREAEIVELQQLSLELGDVAGLHMGDLAAFLVQIRVHDARHQLHEQHDADDAEEIRDAVADRDCVLILAATASFVAENAGVEVSEPASRPEIMAVSWPGS